MCDIMLFKPTYQSMMPLQCSRISRRKAMYINMQNCLMRFAHHVCTIVRRPWTGNFSQQSFPAGPSSSDDINKVPSKAGVWRVNIGLLNLTLHCSSVHIKGDLILFRVGMFLCIINALFMTLRQAMPNNSIS